MNNQYISRYSHYDTHFKRTDPFKGASFEDDSFKAKEAVIITVIAVLFIVGLLLGGAL